MVIEMHRYLIAIAIAVLLTGCTVGQGTATIPASADSDSIPSLGYGDSGSDYKILVANGLSENLTLLERNNETWSVTQEVLPTGQAPAQMVVRGILLYIVNSLSNSIQVVDIEKMEIIHEISTGAGTNPIAIAFYDDNTVLVSCYLTDEILVLDIKPETPSDQRIIASIPLPSPEDLPHDSQTTSRAAPGGLVIDNDRCFVVCSNLSYVHVAGGPGVLAEIDIPSRTLTTTHTLSGRDTTGIIHSPRFPRRLVLVSAGNYELAEGFTGTGTVESFDLDSGEIFQVVEVDGAPFDGEIGPDDILFLENALEAKVLRVDLHAGIELGAFDLPEHGTTFSYASAILPLPGLLIVTDFNSDRLYIQDPFAGEILAELQTGDGPDAMVLLD